MKKGKRRWWLIALIAVLVGAAVVAALLLTRTRSTGVHYLTSAAATGTVAKTVQADFTLASSRDSMTISLSGTGSSSASSNGSSAATTASTSIAGRTVTTVSAFTSVAAAGAVAPAVTDGAATLAVRLADVAAPTITALVPISGVVGSSVTLVGSGFTGATAVAFNGRAAVFAVNSDTQITATVPSGATSGPVVVTAPGGAATSAASFTVKPTPSPSSRPTPKPTSSKSSGGSGSPTGSGSSFATRSSGSTSSSSSSSSTAASSSGSSTASGVVTGIAAPAGTAPRALQHLLTISGTPIFAFVSPTPLYKTLSTSLSAGAQRTNVAALQRALKTRGYFTGTVNGLFGASTATALEKWQSAHGLSKTGEITTSQFVWVPTGATIESWSVGLGGSVSSATALATIDFPRDLIAQALVTQADISSLKVGQKAALTIDGETSDPFVATITSIASQPASSSSAGGSSSTVDYTVDLDPHSLPSLARSGMTGSLTVTIASRSNVLVVPTSAVSGSSSATFVRVMMNGAPTYRQVTTGLATSSLTQIVSGLTAGEVVVTGTYTNSATSSASSGNGLSGLGGLGGGGGFIRRSSSGSAGSPPIGGGGQ